MNLTIRPLTIAELPLCESFARGFFEEKKLPGTFSMETFIQNWTAFLTQYQATILTLWDGPDLLGGLGAMITPDLFDGRLTATEMFWYLKPQARHGLGAFKLVDEFEAWGDSKGAVEFRLAHMLMPGESPATVKLAPIYKRRKYRALEVSYIKSNGGRPCPS
ncbi:MAG: hypothetical protein HQL97_00375 [Magnetococcales bacterium]|nr:hypothetical protein [Magnetococcales bacterium]